MKRPTYLAWFVASTALVLGASTLLALAMDPYGIFRLDGRERPVLESNIAQMKVFQAVQRGAHGVILGNSRADVGFDPGHRLFADAGTVAHNLAAPGTGIESSLAQLSALCDNGRIDLVVLGIDFVDFIRPAEHPRAPFQVQKMLAVPSTGQYARALFSAEALSDSFRALQAQNSERVNRQTASGMNLLNAYAAEARATGYAPFFEQFLAENAKRWAPHSWELMERDESSPTALRNLLSIRRSCGARLVVVTYPYHLQYLALLREAGLWKTFEKWKRLLTNLIAESDSGRSVVLVDVSRASSAAQERIPERGDLATIPVYYWESGHFKSALGNLVLDAAMNVRPAAEVVAAVRLDPSNIESVLEADRIALERALTQDLHLRESVTLAWRNQLSLLSKRRL